MRDLSTGRRRIKMEKVYIASFDMGSKNFAFSVEWYDVDSLQRLQNCTLIYQSDGTPHSNTAAFICKVQQSGVVACVSNTDISDADEKGKVGKNTLCNLNELLTSCSYLWDMCHYIVIEKQMSFGNKNNPQAVRLQHQVESFFLTRYGRLCTLVDFAAYHKTRVLGAIKEQISRRGKTKWKAVDKKTRKHWAVNTALQMLLSRGDINTYELIDELKKKDDVCDCLLQSSAFVVLHHKKIQDDFRAFRFRAEDPLEMHSPFLLQR
jgi:hypothetical protein